MIEPIIYQLYYTKFSKIRQISRSLDTKKQKTSHEFKMRTLFDRMRTKQITMLLHYFTFIYV